MTEFDAAYWEDRYRTGVGTGRLDPSRSLVDEVSDLEPGRALDAGCGVGGDALWLAARGWRVTAVDVSPSAVHQGRRTAEGAGAALAERLTWVPADLTTWEPSERFDLVTSHYVHVPGPPEALFERLASWVAPGGTLLVVGHAHGDHPIGALLGARQVVDVLPPEAWEVVTAEPRTHVLQRPDGGGPVTLHDILVHARRWEGPLEDA